MEKFFVAVLLFYSLFPLTLARIVCPIAEQELISTNDQLLPLTRTYIQATSEDLRLPEDFVWYIVDESTTTSWCTLPDDGVVGHHVNLTFTEPIVLTAILSKGLSSRYVNNFTLEYSLMENPANFSTYGVTQIPQDFFVPEVFTFFTLEEPITALKLHLNINGGVSTFRLCWKLVLFGCRESTAEEVDIEPAPVETETVFLPCTPTPLACPQQTCPPQESCPPQTCPPQESCPPQTCAVCSTPAPSGGDTNAQSSQASETSDTLAIVLPIALVTILVVSGIVVGGVLICIRYQRVGKLKVKYTREISGAGSVKILDNSRLYQLADHNESSREDRQRSETIRHVENILYGPGTETETGNTGDRVYETVDSGLEKEDDLEYNPNYSVPFQDQSVQMHRNESYNAGRGESAGTSSNGYSYAKVAGNQQNDS